MTTLRNRTPYLGTYKLEQLEVGRVYRDVLSGQLVLITFLTLKPLGDSSPSARGFWFNPTTGAHEAIDIRDGQLEDATDTSLYKPRTNVP